MSEESPRRFTISSRRDSKPASCSLHWARRFCAESIASLMPPPAAVSSAILASAFAFDSNSSLPFKAAILSSRALASAAFAFMSSRILRAPALAASRASLLFGSSPPTSALRLTLLSASAIANSDSRSFEASSESSSSIEPAA